MWETTNIAVNKTFFFPDDSFRRFLKRSINVLFNHFTMYSTVNAVLWRRNKKEVEKRGN